MKGYLLLLLIAIGSCKSEKNNPQQTALFSGEPYTGTVKVKIEPPETASTNYTGRGSLHFVDTGTLSRLVLSGIIKNGESEAGDAGFVLDGTVEQAAWTFQHQGMRYQIDKEGQVSGSNITPSEEYLFSGTLTPTTFKMEVVVNMLDETDGGYPAGTIFRYSYDFARDNPDSRQPSENAGCKNIRWQMRNIWSPGGGGMIMIRVPVCFD